MAVAETDVESLIAEMCERLRDECLGAIADQLHQVNKGEAHSKIQKAAEKAFSALVSARGIRNVVSGKRLISKLSEASKKRYGISFGAMAVCKEMHASEFDEYLVSVVKALA